MAFNINAQIILKAPKDIGKISKSIQSQLSKAGNINIGVNKNLGTTLNGINKSLGGLTKGINTLNATSNKTAQALQRLNTLNAVTSVSAKKLATNQNNLATANTNVAKSANQAAGGLQAFGKQAAASLRSAAAFAVTTRAVFGLTSAIKSGVRDALEFERSLIKISQVTGDSVARLSGLRDTVITLSTELGINANELVEVGRTLAQTGQTAKQVQQSLDALAKSTLAPTFGDIKQTTEGLIASLAQFNIQASQSEDVLASLNAVSKRFAVESEDLIAAIRRAGGVFSTAATDAKEPIEALQQLSAIFTSVRSVTRESAETIATGLRTIFTRIQRRGTIEFLKQFGVELVNAEGNFVGLFEAFKRLSAGLDEIIQKGDALTLSAITEELGGVRQVGKLIPAITNFANAQKALEVAQKGAAEGLTGDVDKALGGLAKRFEQTQAKFQELIRSISESGTFQNLARLALNTADAFISLADKLKPLLPLIATVGASFIAKGATQFAGGFLGAIGGGGLRNVGSTLGGGGGKGASTQGTTQNTQAINQNTLVTNQLSNIFQSVDAGLDLLNRQLASLTKTLTTQVSNLIQAVGGFPTRASGGAIPKFANGGRVYGPSHAAGGVIAELEGGEYVVPKKFANGGSPSRGKRAYVFDFDDTLGVSGSSGKELFSNDPELAASRQNKLRNAKATSLASAAKKRSQQGYDVHVLTARFGTPGDEAALKDFLVNAGISPGRTIFTGGLFKGEREPGKKPGTTRQLSTATKKSRILAELAKEYESILFLDDAIENVLKAKEVSGVTPIAVDKQTQALKRAMAGGVIGSYAVGGTVRKKIKNMYGKKHGLAPSSTQVFSKTGESLGLGEDFFSIRTASEFVEINKDDYEKFVKGSGGFGWEGWIAPLGYGTYRGQAGFPVDFVDGSNLYDAKDFPKERQAETLFNNADAGGKALNYLLYESFKNLGYDYKKRNTLTVDARSARFLGQRITPGEDNFKSDQTITFVFPKIVDEVQEAALGGLIQSLAEGGIAEVNNIGAAVFDAEGAGLKDVQKGFNVNGQDKLYTLVRDELDASIKEGFINAVDDGLVAAAQSTLNKLGSDATVDRGSYLGIINQGQRGSLFEDTLRALQTEGKFSGLFEPGDNFDFTTGLGSTANFFSKFSPNDPLYVDARKSANAAEPGPLFKKLENELRRQGNSVSEGLQPLSDEEKKALNRLQKRAARGVLPGGGLERLESLEKRANLATGGMVPVRISNGEMVVSDPREVAANKGRLQRINKLSTGGFASGYIARGPGSGTSDSIYTSLPEGAFVVNAASTREYLKSYATGGLVGYADGGDIERIQDLLKTKRGALSSGRGKGGRGGKEFAKIKAPDETLKRLRLEIKVLENQLKVAEATTKKTSSGIEEASSSLTVLGDVGSSGSQALEQASNSLKVLGDVSKEAAAQPEPEETKEEPKRQERKSQKPAQKEEEKPEESKETSKDAQETSEALKSLKQSSEEAKSAQEESAEATKQNTEQDTQQRILQQQAFQQLAGAASAATTAFATFDLSNPLASITSLGFAAFEATRALEDIKAAAPEGEEGDPSPIGDLGEKLLEFKKDFTEGLEDGASAFKPDQLKQTFDPSNLKKSFANPVKSLGGQIKGLSLGQLAGKAAAGGAAAAAVSAAVGPVVDGLTDSLFGAKEEIEGFTGRADTTGGEAAAIAGIGEGLKGAAAGAAAGLVFGPVGAAIGGIVGGIGAGVIGAIEATLQQEAFNALQSLKQASEDAAKGLDDFISKTDVTSSDIDEVNKRLSNLTADIGPTLEKTFTASLGITGGLAVAAGDDPGGAVFGRSLADGIDGADLATLAASPITALITLGNTFQDLAGQAGEFIGIGSEAGQAIAGFVAPLSNLGTVLSTVTNFGLEMFGLDAATQAATATAESFEAVLNTIGPENIEKANEALAKSAAQFVKDLDTLGDLEAIDQLSNLNVDTTFTSEATAEFAKLNQILDESASNGNKFAGALKEQLAQTSKLNVLKGVKDQIDLLIASGDKAAAADLGQAFQALQNTPVDQIEKAAFALESTGQIGTTAAEALSKLGNAERDRVLQLVKQNAAQQKANRLLQEAQRNIDALAEGLNKFSNVAGGAAQQFDIFTNNLTQSIDQAFSDTAGGFQVERFNPFENLDIATDFDIGQAFEEFKGLASSQGDADTAFAGLEDFAKLQREVPFLLKDTLTQSIATGGLEETASPEKVLEEIKKGLQDANIQVPDVALQSLAKNLQAQASTDQDGKLSTTNIIRALEEGGDLANLFGEIGSKFQDALASVRSAQDQVTNNLLRISDLQLKIARQEREFNLSQVKRAQAAEDRIAKIRGKAATNQLGRAQANLGAQATAIAGSADPNQLLARRQASINQRNVLQTQLQTGRTATGAVASQQEQKEAADKLAVLNNEFESTTQALNLLANETDRLAAIEAEVAAAKEKERTATNAGISLIERLQNEQKTGVRDTSIDEDLASVKSLQTILKGGNVGQDEALGVLKEIQSGNNDIFKVALEQAKAENPNLDPDTLKNNLLDQLIPLAAQTQGAKDRNLGPFLEGVIQKQIDDSQSDVEKLAQAAEGIFAQQSGILQSIFDQNKQQAVQALQQADAAFLDSVTKFDEAVQQFADLRAREADEAEVEAINEKEAADIEKTQADIDKNVEARLQQEGLQDQTPILNAIANNDQAALQALKDEAIAKDKEEGGTANIDALNQSIETQQAAFEKTKNALINGIAASAKAFRDAGDEEKAKEIEAQLGDRASINQGVIKELSRANQDARARREGDIRKEETAKAAEKEKAIKEQAKADREAVRARGDERDAQRKAQREARAAGTQTQTGIPTGIATPVADLEADLKSKEAEAEQAKQNLQDAVAKDPGAGFEITNLENIAAQAQQDVEDAKAKLQQAGGGAGAAGGAGAIDNILSQAAEGLPSPEEIYQNALAAGNPYAERFNPANEPALVGSAVTDTGALPPDLAAQVEQSVAGTPVATQQPQQAAQTRQQVAAQTAGPIRGAASGQIQPFSRVAQQAQGEIGVLQKKLEAAGGFSQEDQQKLQQLKQKRDAGEELTGKERREVRSLQQRQTFSKAIGKREGVVEQDAAKQQLGEAFKEGGKVVAQGINAGVEGLKTAAALIPETINTTLGGEVTLNLLGTQGLEDSIIEKVQQIVKEQIAPLLPNNKAPQEGQIGNKPSN